MLSCSPGLAYRVEGGRVIPINVKTAFHSRYMHPVAKSFEDFLATQRFSPLLIPVISNFTALPYRDDEIVNNLVTWSSIVTVAQAFRLAAAGCSVPLMSPEPAAPVLLLDFAAQCAARSRAACMVARKPFHSERSSVAGVSGAVR